MKPLNNNKVIMMQSWKIFAICLSYRTIDLLNILRIRK